MDNYLINNFRVFGESDGNASKLSLSNFLTGISQLKFRGTSLLLRSPKSIVEHLISKNTPPLSSNNSRKRRKTGPPNDMDNNDNDNDDVFSSPRLPAPPSSTSSSKRSKLGSTTSSLATSVSFEDYDNDDDDEDALDESSGACINPPYDLFPRKYEFATHAVKVKRSGQVIDVQSLWDLESVGAVSSNSVFAPELRTRLERIHSVRAFNTSTDANEMLRGLKFFERATNGNERTPKKPALNWGNVSLSLDI